APMETQHGNAPLINRVWIEIAIAIFVGNHFPAARKSDIGAVHASATLFQWRSVPLVFFANIIELTHHRHAPDASKLYVIAAQKVVLAVELPPWHVQMHPANPIVI